MKIIVIKQATNTIMTHITCNTVSILSFLQRHWDLLFPQPSHHIYLSELLSNIIP